MILTITPTKLKGAVIPPPSKSQAHRALIAAALAEGESRLDNVAPSRDIQATVDCLTELGAEFIWAGDAVTVHGMGAGVMSPLRRMAHPVLDCGESGSTLRFLMPVALAVRGGGRFLGRGRLMERPQKPYFDIFGEKGIFYEQKENTLTLQGLLTPGEYRLPGNVSSQFITGLLYALPLLNGDSWITLTSPLESRGYVDMTLDVLNLFGIYPEMRENGFFIPGNRVYAPQGFCIEVDWSQAAFWYVAQTLGSTVEVGGMDPGSAQGDTAILEFLNRLAAERELSFDVSQCPDLVPPMAAAAALAPGRVTRLTNAARLRLKESDRLTSVTQVLNALGADIEEGEDFLLIHGKEMLQGGVTVDSWNDHRIAMMAAIAATRCGKPITLTGAESVGKSYPTFWEEYARLGGKTEEVTV